MILEDAKTLLILSGTGNPGGRPRVPPLWDTVGNGLWRRCYNGEFRYAEEGVVRACVPDSATSIRERHLMELLIMAMPAVSFSPQYHRGAALLRLCPTDRNTGARAITAKLIPIVITAGITGSNDGLASGQIWAFRYPGIIARGSGSGRLFCPKIWKTCGGISGSWRRDPARQLADRLHAILGFFVKRRR